MKKVIARLASECVCWDYEAPDAECTCGAMGPAAVEVTVVTKADEPDHWHDVGYCNRLVCDRRAR